MINEPELLLDRYLARNLRVTVGWLRDEADAGRLPHVKAGNRYLFNSEAVRRVLLERAATLPPEVLA
ncbi:MAG: hypothetical protein QGG71_26590 [Pirellulaceae bacterium]|jgi:hypothetical protein|nr:hypothetical protein [Pirellulaceae bacterium]